MVFFQKIFRSHRNLAVVFLLGGGSSVSFSQGRSDQRLDQKLDRRVVEGFDRAPSSKEGLDVSLITSLAYDSNIFLSADDEIESVVLQVEPSIGWTAGERDKSWIRLAYEGAAVVYFFSEDDNRVDNRVVTEGEVRKKNLALAYSARWARLGSPSADVGGQNTRQEWGGSASLSYTPKGKISYRAFIEQSEEDQSDSGLFDSSETSGGVAAEYRYSSKTAFELAYRLGRVDIEGTGVQTFQRFGFQTSWSPRPKLSFSFEGGLEYRNYVVGDGLEPYLSARADWTPRAKTAFYAEAYRRVEASAALDGENFVLAGFRAGVNQQFAEGWTGGFEFGRETADYFSVSSLPESGREDSSYFVRPTVRYVFDENKELVFLYQWSQSDSTIADFGFDNHQVGLSMNYQF